MVSNSVRTAERSFKAPRSGVIRTPHPRLGRRKFAASLGPHQRCRKPGASQGAGQPRQRLCLLKGCEKPFRPARPQARYCSRECQAAARLWRRRRASERYRQTINGRENRQAQKRKYRSRRAEGQRAEAAQTGLRSTPDPQCASGVQQPGGQRPATEFGFFCCDRPGCEVHFPRPHLISRRRYCSPSCRQALRRVLERERRWRLRLGSRRCRRVAGLSHGP